MLSKWPIRAKLLLGLGLLVLVVVILASSGLHAMYLYRGLVKSLSWRVVELPVAARLSRQVGDLRVTLSRLHGLRENSVFLAEDDNAPVRLRLLREEFRLKLKQVEDTLAEYRAQLEHQFRSGLNIADNRSEWATVRKIDQALESVHQVNCAEDWVLDQVKVGQLDGELEHLQVLATELPSHFHARLAGIATAERNRYRMLIVGSWITSITGALLFALFVRLAWTWVLHPLRKIIHGSRRVAGGEFGYRIRLQSEDEMAELAEALNDMTARFQAIRDDLDRQVQERTKQVVRSEQLASVGFLAAGVAHEINNPLASIAMCAESLETRLSELFESAGIQTIDNAASPGSPRAPLADQLAVIGNYLQMVQKEAFRCKEITEKLLDFSRIGQVRRQPTELGELVRDVVEMVGHMGKYQGKHVELALDEPVTAPVNPQEIKQVVLNLLTNALDSLDDGGNVRIALRRRRGLAELSVADNGCGMAPETLEHVFEPFFTRRRGGQGTGLGLSISYRIVTDHGGNLEAESPGPGQGATFRVLLPVAENPKEVRHRHQAA